MHASVLRAQVVINEITPDPGNYDGQGAEWAELYNTGAAPVDVSCWVLSDGEEIIVLPAGTIIPAGGYLLIYNSHFFNCATCNWDPTIIAQLQTNPNVKLLDLAACGCTNQASCYSVTWENSGAGGNPNNDAGERIVLFDANATIVDALYYGSGARVNGGAIIPEDQYADGPLTAGVEIVGGGTTGCTLPASNNYDIPAIPATPATSDATYEYTGQNAVGCTSSISRSSDGSSVWRLDAWPSPGQTNALADYSVTYRVSTGAIIDMTATDVVNVNICSGETLTFNADIYGFNQVYTDNDGDNTEGNLEGGSVRGGSNIDATGTLVLNNAPWTENPITAGGVTNLNYTTAPVTGATTIKLFIKENTQSVQQPAPGAPYGPGDCPGISDISGQGAGAECYIEKTIVVHVAQAITSIQYTCVNGLVTVTTTPSANFGSYTLLLDNTVNNSLDRTFTVAASPFTFQVAQGNASDYNLLVSGSQNPACGALPAVTGGPICVFAPLCATFQNNVSCPANSATPCPGDQLNFGLDAGTSVNLPDGARIEWVNDTDNDNDVYDEGAGAVAGVQVVSIVNVPPVYKTCGTLSAGDIVITDVQTDADRFTFVPLVNIAAGTTIYFTDVSVNAGNWYNTTGEGGHIGWTAPVGGVTAGTQITISVSGVLTSGSTTNISMNGPGTLSYFEQPASNDFALAANGDQVLAYCGTAGTYPASFLAGVTTYALNLWQYASADGANSSDLPTGLTNNATAVAVGKSTINGDEWDNAVFNCTGGTVSGSYSAVRATINNSANWTGNDDAQSLSSCSISVTGSGGSTVTTLSPACVSYIVPTTACNSTLRIKPRISPDQSGCTGGSAVPTLPTQTFVVTCPEAALSGEAAICSGMTASMPVFLANVPAGCTSLSGTYSINGGGNVAFGPLSIVDDIALLTGLSTAGVITLTAITFSGAGCTSCPAGLSGSFTLTVDNNPANPVITDAAVCFGQASAIGATGASDLLWYSDAAGTMVIGGGSSISVNTAAPLTVYVQSVNPDNGCRSAIIPATLTLNPLPAATADDVTVCRTSALSLSGAGTATVPATVTSYIWSTNSSNGFSSTIEDPLVTASAALTDAGTYTLYVEDSNGCYDTDEATVTVNDLPVYTPVLTAPTCTATGLISVAAISTPPGATYTYAYYPPGGPAFVPMTLNGSQYEIVLPAGPQSASVYSVLVTRTDVAPDCSFTQNVNVAAVTGCCTDPTVSTVNACLGSAPVTFTQAGGNAGGTWAVDGGGTIDAAGIFTPSATGCFNASYTTPIGGCTDSESFVVFPNPPVLIAPSNTCNTAFALPSVAAVPGFDVAFSINGSAWSSAPTLPVAPGIYSIEARYVLSTACGTIPAGTTGPACGIISPVSVEIVAPPSVAAAGTDQNVCITAGSVALAANAPATGTGVWSVVSGPSTDLGQFSSTTANNATFTPSGGAGTYLLRWTISNAPCAASSDDVEVIFTAPPSVAAAGTDQNVCITAGSVALAANAPATGTGVWSVVSGPSTDLGQFSSTTANNATFTPSGGAGTYLLRWTISNAPCAASSDDVEVIFTASPSVAAAGPDQNVCITAGSVALAANAPATGTGVWSVVSGPSTDLGQFSSTTANNATFTPSGGAGTYLLRWTISNAPCAASSDDVEVIFTASPSVAAAGTDQNVCITAGSVALAANAPATGTGAWSVVSGPSTDLGQFSSTTANNATFTPSGGAGTYLLRWTISNAPCAASSDDVEVIFTASPSVAAAGTDQNVCITAGSVALAANAPATGTGVWSVVSGPSTDLGQFSSTTANNATFTPSGGAGTYLLRWTISNAPCAASSDDVEVIFTASPSVAAAGPDQNVCITAGSVALAANAPATGTGVWSVVSGPSTDLGQFSSTTANNATFTPSGGAGTYLLRWTISNAPCAASSDDVEVIFTASPSVAAAGPDQNVCITAGSVALAANAPATGTGVWSVVSGPSTDLGQFSSTTANNATFTPSGGAGTYLLRWTISNAPCAASSDDVEVIFTASPSVAAAGPDQNVCITAGSVALAANAPATGTGVWSVVSGPSTDLGQFSSTTANNATFTPSGGAGTYLLRWTISNAPCAASSDDVEVIFTASPSVAAAGPDQNVCITAGSVALAANAPATGTGVWSVVSGPSTDLGQFSSTTANNATFTPSGGAGTYLLRWTISNAPCAASSDDVEVIFTASPSVAAAGTDQNVCITAGSVALAANAPATGTGVWSVVSGPSTDLGQFSSTTANNATFTPSGGAGTYLLRWTISNAPCAASSDDVEVIFTASPSVAAAGPDQNVCITAGSVALAANAPATGTGVWSVVSGPSTDLGQFSSTTANNATFTPSGGAGTYLLRWTISNAPCAASSDDVEVIFTASPSVAAAGPDQNVCITAGSVALAANAPATGTGAWSVVSGPSTDLGQFSSTTANNATFTPSGGAGTYLLRWTISNAPCAASSDDVEVIFTASPSVAAAGPDQNVCITAGSVALAANAPATGTGVWSVVSGPSTDLGQFSSTTANNATFTPSGGAGTYLLRWTISNAPCAASSDDVEVIFTASPSVAAAGPDQNVCITAGSVALAANAPATGTGAWSVVSGPSTDLGQFSSTTANNATFTPSGGAGTYLLRWTISNAPCAASSDDVEVVFADSPTGAAVGPNQIVCSILPNVVLSGNTPIAGTGVWTITSGPSLSVSQFADPFDPTTVFTAGSTGVYVLRWTISNAPCPATFAEMTVTVIGQPDISNAGPDQSGLCPFTSTNLSANIPTTGIGTWSVVSGPSTSAVQFSSLNDRFAVFTPNGGPGVYTLRWSIANLPCSPNIDDVVLTFQDLVVPSITCPASLTVNTGIGLCSAIVNYALPVFSDNCTVPAPVVSRLSGPASGSAFPAGNTTVVWQVRDASGNTATCAFVVMVEDKELPKILCPGSLTISAAVGSCGAVMNHPAITASDNCGTPAVTQLSGLVNGSLFPVGATVMTYQATDGAVLPNTATCSFTIVVSDAQAPSITCPANQSVVTGLNICSANVTYTKPTVSDNCSLPVGQPMWVSGGAATTVGAATATATFSPTINTVIWKVTDASGNSRTCSFRVTVTDNQAPIINCPSAPVVLNTSAGLCTAPAVYTVPTATDNCTAVPTVTRISGPAPGTLLPSGMHTVVFRATDVGGRSSTCQLKLQVLDTYIPSITCPASLTLSAAPNLCCVVVNYAVPPAMDNCSGATVILQSGLASGSLFYTGVNTVLLQATDASGNTSTCSFTVTILDTQSPVIICPPSVTVAGSGSPCGFASNLLLNPTVQENCVLQSLTSNAPVRLPGGSTTTISWTATDEANLVSTCQYNVTVLSCNGTRSGVEAVDRTTVEHTGLRLQLVPNPALTEVHIGWKGASSEGGDLLLYDAAGRLLWRRNIETDAGVYSLDIGATGVVGGLYYVTLRTERSVVSHKLMVAE